MGDGAGELDGSAGGGASVDGWMIILALTGVLWARTRAPARSDATAARVVPTVSVCLTGDTPDCGRSTPGYYSNYPKRGQLGRVLFSFRKVLEDWCRTALACKAVIAQ
jgi:hypothetical protein